MTRRLHILLVEDNPGDVRLMREALSEKGFDVRLDVVGDGIEALGYLEPGSPGPAPDLILLDLNLPRMDGFEVLAAIKGDARLRAIPVVVLTTSSDDRDVRRAYDLQANCFVTKPIDSDELGSILSVLERFWMTVARLPARGDS